MLASARTVPATLPPLFPPSVQLPLWDAPSVRHGVSELRYGDALCYGAMRLEWVCLASGGYSQLRLYRRDRIIGVTVVRNSSLAGLQALLVPLLCSLGWSDCCIECGAAEKRRATRRKLSTPRVARVG